jgi:hypothetical protein
VTVDAEAFEVLEEHRGEGGEAVDVLEIDGSTAIVYP